MRGCRRVEDRPTAEDVRIDIVGELNPGVTYSRARSEVERDIDVAEQLGERIAGNVGLHQLKPRLGGQGREVQLLESARVVIAEGLNAYDVVSVGEEALGELRSDEAGRAGYQPYETSGSLPVLDSCFHLP